MTIYVVMGSTGEYSDRNEWPVIAFSDKNLAEKLIMQMDYTGTHYFYYEIELD